MLILQLHKFTIPHSVQSVIRRAFITRWKDTDRLRLFETDPIPVPEDEWKPKKGLHFPEQFYGLYAGAQPVKSFRITKFGRKRRFHAMPMVTEQDLFSEIMDDTFRFKTTTKAMRAIEKAGGLDNYLLKSSLDEINSYEGIRVRKMLKARLEAQNAAKEKDQQSLLRHAE